MPTQNKIERLEAIEVQLSPKQWGIRLAHALRSHPSEVDFLRSVANQPYVEWPWVKPFFRLCEQGKIRVQAERTANIPARKRSATELRWEFHTLQKLIRKSNETVKIKAETIGLKTALKLSTLNTIMFKEAIGFTARKLVGWANRGATADARVAPEIIIDELAHFTQIDVEAQQYDSTVICNWVDEMTMHVMEAFSLQAAVREIQQSYFDGHSILFLDAELRLAGTLNLIETAVSTLNEYLPIRYDISKIETVHQDQSAQNLHAVKDRRDPHLAIDLKTLRDRAEQVSVGFIADQWVREARENAKIDILQESGEHENYLRQTLRNRIK
jgi:hypothetical protein